MSVTPAAVLSCRVSRSSRRSARRCEAGAGRGRAGLAWALGGHVKLSSLVAHTPEDRCPWHAHAFTSLVQVGCRRRFVLPSGNTEAAAGATARSRVTHVEG